MSSVRVAYFWADGSHMDAQAWADDASPVAMAVARVSAVEALFEAMGELESADEDTDVLYPPADEADE